MADSVTCDTESIKKVSLATWLASIGAENLHVDCKHELSMADLGDFSMDEQCLFGEVEWYEYCACMLKELLIHAPNASCTPIFISKLYWNIVLKSIIAVIEDSDPIGHDDNYIYVIDQSWVRLVLQRWPYIATTRSAWNYMFYDNQILPSGITFIPSHTEYPCLLVHYFSTRCSIEAFQELYHSTKKQLDSEQEILFFTDCVGTPSTLLTWICQCNGPAVIAKFLLDQAPDDYSIYADPVTGKTALHVLVEQGASIGITQVLLDALTPEQAWREDFNQQRPFDLAFTVMFNDICDATVLAVAKHRPPGMSMRLFVYKRSRNIKSCTIRRAIVHAETTALPIALLKLYAEEASEPPPKLRSSLYILDGVLKRELFCSNLLETVSRCIVRSLNNEEE